MSKRGNILLLIITIILVALCTLALIIGVAAGSAFPEIDRTKLRITLQRSACYGSCPDYTVTIYGDGLVLFATRPQPTDSVAALHRSYADNSGVVVSGMHQTHISAAAINQLVQRFRDARFFALHDEYRAGVTDNPTYVTTIDTGNGSKTVLDYAGTEVGMPTAVTDLQNAVDQIAKTRRWIEGTPDVIPLLIAEGARFDGPLGLGLMNAAVARNDVPTLQRLRQLGAPVDGGSLNAPLVNAARTGRAAAAFWLIDQGGARRASVVKTSLLVAVERNNVLVAERLLQTNAARELNEDELTALLRVAANNGNEAFVRLFLARGGRLNGRPSDGPLEDPPLFNAAQGEPWRPQRSIVERRRVVRLLLDAGAEANWRHPVFQGSVLFQVSDAQIAQMLLDAGADPNFEEDDEFGEPVIFSVSSEDVALAMIRAGANLRSVRRQDNMTLRRWTTVNHWPRVRALIDRAHH